MPTIHYDYWGGNNANDGLTRATAKRTPQNTDHNPGDTLLFKRGVENLFDINFGLKIKGFQNETVAAGRWTTVGVYGEAQVPYAILQNTNASGPTLNIDADASTNTGVRIEDVYAKAVVHTSHALQVLASAAEARRIHVRRSIFEGNPSSVSSCGMWMIGSSTGLRVENVLVEDSIFRNSGQHGFGCRDPYGVVVRRCKSTNNGLATGAHGFTIYSRETTFNTSWSGTGPVFSKPYGFPDAYYVSIGGTLGATLPKLAKSATSTSSPAPGEFSVNGGNLYVNTTTNPGTDTVFVCIQLSEGVSFINCDSWANKAYFPYPAREGHGFAFDNYSQDSRVIGCRSWDNEGLAVSMNRGDRNVVAGLIGYNNAFGGIHLNRGNGCVIANNVLFNNGYPLPNLPVSYTGEINVVTQALNARVFNNIIDARRLAYGIVGDASTSATLATGKNVINALTARVNGFTESGAVAWDNPFQYLNGDYAPYPTFNGVRNPLDGAGTWVQGARTFRGAPLVPGRVPIGAKMPAGVLPYLARRKVA